MKRTVKLRLRIDFKAMKYFNMYNLKYKKKFMWFYIGMIILCIGAGAVTIYQKQYILGIVFAVFALYLIYQTVKMESMIDRQIANYFYQRRPVEQVLEIDDEKIKISSPKDPEKSVEYDWLQVTAIHEIPQYFYLFLNKQPLIVDKDENMILEGNHQDIIYEKTSGKPYKKIEKEIVKNPITFVHPEFDEEEEKAGDLEVHEIETVEDAVVNEETDVEEIPVEVEDKKEV